MNLPIDHPRKTKTGMISRWRSLAAAAAAAAVVLLGMSGLLKPLPNACVMTYMYPTYVPVPHSSSSSKYGLFLYHEGWKPIDFVQHLRTVSGVPVLFIPGNGGSYKQVRSLGAESDRAFNGGPTEETYYRESTFTPDEAGIKSEKSWWMKDEDHAHVRDVLENDDFQGTYVNRLDWFAVDLEGEHSALDGRILEEHTEYVVQAIHRILDLYKESSEARAGGKKANEEELPKSVILVGHSMGGFVARAAVVHPNLRKGVVETVITVSSPHLLAPLALQPSLGHFFSRVNNLWRLGYETSRRTRLISEPLLANVVVISLPGGIHDYQVRSRMASLDGIVPATHSLTVGAPGMLNAWLSTEHQTILWCNQLVVQLSHTLLKIVDKNTGQALTSPRKRLAIFIANLRSALPQTLEWLPTADASKSEPESSQALNRDKYACPKGIRWESRERDLKVDTSSVTILAMDGRRRWLDIKKQASHGKTSFVLVTNLSPCHGIRVHLWPGKGKDSKEVNPVEVTTRMVQLPATPAPRQAEPGGKSEQAPPSGILKLGPSDLKGFQYLTISVAPRPTVTGRPPQAASMAVGQFFNSEDGTASLSPWRLLYSLFRKQNILLEENHPLVVDVSVSAGFGVLPLATEIQTASCGIPDTTLYRQETGDSDVASLCKLRCFPPIALLWDPYVGLQVVPNLLRSQTIVSDSSAVLTGLKHGSQDPALVLLVDPHCGYNISFEVAKFTTFNRFILTQAPQIGGFMVAVLLFALMRQARAWELDQPIPSIHACLEGNLIFPVPFIPLCIGSLFLYFASVSLGGDVPPPYVISTLVAVVCYLFASGTMALIAVSSTILFHATASLQLFFQSRWHSWVNRRSHPSLQRVATQLSACFSFEMVKRVRAMPRLTVGVMATVLAFFVHPALGLALVLLSHTCSCHGSLCRYRYREVWQKSQEDGVGKTSRSSHLESFKFFQALLLLHFTATAMLLPSLIAWIQRPKVDQTLPWLLDSSLSFGVILHGLYAANGGPESVYLDCLRLPVNNFGLSLVYGVGAVYAYWGGLLQAPYRAFHVLAAIGFFTSALRYRSSSSSRINNSRRHFHRH